MLGERDGGTESTVTAVKHHILTVLVENKFGVLSRVAGLFARRGFNIVSLAVSPTEDERFSRMTIVVDAESAPLEQITKQLNKLIPVLKIAELHPDEAVERELQSNVLRRRQPRQQVEVLEDEPDRSATKTRPFAARHRRHGLAAGHHASATGAGARPQQGARPG